MRLADKIVTLRKRAGWSQEELAAQLGVSRQSVSKWEGAQSVPDLQKVVQMSRLPQRQIVRRLLHGHAAQRRVRLGRGGFRLAELFF